MCDICCTSRCVLYGLTPSKRTGGEDLSSLFGLGGGRIACCGVRTKRARAGRCICRLCRAWMRHDGPRFCSLSPLFRFENDSPLCTPPLFFARFHLVLHHGRSIHGGHYTALVRDPRGEWKHYDDQHVTPETEGHALNPMSGHPYLLLYTRM